MNQTRFHFHAAQISTVFVPLATLALFVLLAEGADPAAKSDSSPPPAAAAKVRIWTVILVDGEIQQPLERISVEVRCSKSGHREPQPMTFTSGSGGEVRIPLATGTSTPVLVRNATWWTGSGASIGSPEQDSSKPVT